MTNGLKSMSAAEVVRDFLRVLGAFPIEHNARRHFLRVCTSNGLRL